jgi:hypothetical protein
MKALTELNANRTAIMQLPASFDLLKNLKILSLSGRKRQASKLWLLRTFLFMDIAKKLQSHTFAPNFRF